MSMYLYNPSYILNMEYTLNYSVLQLLSKNPSSSPCTLKYAVHFSNNNVCTFSPPGYSSSPPSSLPLDFQLPSEQFQLTHQVGNICG